MIEKNAYLILVVKSETSPGDGPEKSQALGIVPNLTIGRKTAESARCSIPA